MPKPASLEKAIRLDYPRDIYGNLKFAEGEMEKALQSGQYNYPEEGWSDKLRKRRTFLGTGWEEPPNANAS